MLRWLRFRSEVRRGFWGRDIALFPAEWGKSGSRRVSTWNRRCSRIADAERMRIGCQRLPWEFNYSNGTMATAPVMKGPSPRGHRITWYLQYISQMVVKDAWIDLPLLLWFYSITAKSCFKVVKDHSFV